MDACARKYTSQYRDVIRAKVILYAADGMRNDQIAERLDTMVADGFIDEVRRLRERPGLTGDSTSVRSVGYRQFWQHLEGEIDLEEARQRALFATRQLAKRQLTWLRSEKSLISVNSLEAGVIDSISTILARHLA